jgi:hypothetical protein
MYLDLLEGYDNVAAEVFMTAHELQQYKEQLIAEHRQEIAAIDRLIAREALNSGSRNGATKPIEPQKPPEQRRDMLRNVLSGMPGEFTRDEVEARMKQMYGVCPYDRQSLAIELWKFSRGDTLEVVKEGRGRIPAVYRRK